MDFFYPIKSVIYNCCDPGKSMSAHADELEKSYFQLSGYLAQENLGVPAG